MRAVTFFLKDMDAIPKAFHKYVENQPKKYLHLFPLARLQPTKDASITDV